MHPFKRISHIKTIGSDLLNLIYPRLCVSCNDLLINFEAYVCTKCIYNLPKTNFHLDRSNPVAKLFWGRVDIEHASSYSYFTKGSKFRRLLHHLKYKGKREIGYYLGKAYGSELLLNNVFTDTDIVVPVPLHPAKEKQRGFNQSERVAQGIADALRKPMKKILERTIDSATQTRKTRYERWENVENIFTVVSENEIHNKHVLLVDDVVTTGATLEACAQKLQEAAVCKVSIVTLAVS